MSDIDLSKVPKNIILAEVKTRVINNPVFEDIISSMIDETLYTGYLTKANVNGAKTVLSYNGKAALDVIVDSISREIIKSYKEGFGITPTGVVQDGASNVNYFNPTQTAVPLTSFGTANNVNDALSSLAAEVQLMKSTLSIFFNAASTIVPPAQAAATAMSVPATYVKTTGQVSI